MSIRHRAPNIIFVALITFATTLGLQACSDPISLEESAENALLVQDRHGTASQNEELAGTVTSIDLSTDRFDVLEDGATSPVTFSVDGATVYDGLPGLADLEVGDVVEVEYEVQSDGSFLAVKVELEEEEGEDEEEQVVICHIPPGNPDAAHTIEIGESSVDDHLAHGDVLGECEEEGDGEEGEGEDDDEGDEEEKVVICHFPPGNPDAAVTIEVSASSVDNHLAHGDVLGECENEDDSEDDEEENDDEEEGDGAKKVVLCHVPPGNPDAAVTIEVNPSAAEGHLAHGDTEGACAEEDDDD